MFVLRPLLFRFYSVAFVPPDNVTAAFEELFDKIRNAFNADAYEILGYIEDSYIGRYRTNASRRPPAWHPTF